ncbi:MAG: hypothetical protein GQ547_00095 [Methylophaga sp.]|nr:hypothetical protein [Methylophaga sp.]
MSETQDFEALTRYAKAFTGLTPEREACLLEVSEQLQPLLATVTDKFYEQLGHIPETAPFLEGRVDTLKKSHLAWIQSLFTGPFDISCTELMYKVGDIHVKVHLPVEFMAGAMSMINNELILLVIEQFADDQEKMALVLTSINSITSFSLFVMQQSYQESTVAEELDKFLRISGMSRVLFTNLANAYSD